MSSGMESQETLTSDSPKAVSPHPDPDKASRAKLDRSLVHSLAWRAAGDWASQIFSWASLLIIVRLLAPSDFGMVAMAVIFYPFLRQSSEFCIPRIIVTFRDLSEEQIGQLNTAGALLGGFSFLLACAAAKPIAIFFKNPALVPVFVATCAALVPLGLRSVSEGLLTRDMQFRLLSLYDALNAVVSAAVTLVLAAFHFRYWALVLGNLVAISLRSLLVWRARPFRFAIPQLKSIKQELQFGWHVLVSLVALNSYQRLDNLTSGRVLGQTALGYYGMAWTLANVPLEKVTSLVTTVVPSYLAAVQTDKAALRRYVRTLTESVALATFPATIGLGLVARELIPFALGHKWAGVIAPLEVLSIYAAFRSIVALLPKVLTSVGNARYVMWNDLAALVVLPIAFYIGSHWGNTGIAWGWVLAYPIVVIPLYRQTLRTVEMRLKEYVLSLRPAVEGSIAMAIAVLAVRHSFSTNLPIILRLMLEIVTGAAAYSGTLLLLHRERMLAFLRLGSTLRNRRK